MKPRLTEEQKAQIPQLRAFGAETYGFRGDVWTARRVAEVIRRTDRACSIIVIMSVACCARQDGVDGHSIERATQRDEAAITDW